MKFVPTALAGAVTLALAQFAMAQAPRVIAPNSDNRVNVEQQGVQNSQQIGSGNQSSQVLGNDNQSTTQQGSQNQSATGSSAQQSQQYGKGNDSSQGGTSAYEQ